MSYGMKQTSMFGTDGGGEQPWIVILASGTVRVGASSREEALRAAGVRRGDKVVSCEPATLGLLP